MIFQAPINLNIDDRIVQAIIDLDTWFIGFTESCQGKNIEYYYAESPVEFKKALIKILEPLFDEKSLTNFKVSRKNEKMRFISKHLE